VGILADPEVEATFNPFWGIQANTPDDPVEFALVEGAELNGTWLGFTNLQPGSLAGLASLNLPIPLENNLDRAILNVNFFTTDWETDEEQGEVGGVFQPEFADALWMPTLDPGEPYTLIDEDIAVYFNGVPTDRNNVHEEAVGTTGWLFRRYDGFSVIGTGALSSNGYSFANEVNTTELVGWDEASYIFD